MNTKVGMVSYLKYNPGIVPTTSTGHFILIWHGTDWSQPRHIMSTPLHPNPSITWYAMHLCIDDLIYSFTFIPTLSHVISISG